MKIRYRFPKFHLDWKEDEFKCIFDFHQTNTFSRSQMNNRRGFARNIHYGDILTKYGNILSDLQEVPYINKDISLLKVKEESYLQNGDIIIADTAEDLTVGKAMEVQNIDGKILSGLHTILCRPKFKFSPRFLGYNLNSSSYRRNLIPLVVGVKVCSISKTNISKTSVMYPDDINEQQKIADCLSSIDELISAEEKKLSLLNEYKKGWMQKLFPAEDKTIPEWRFPEFQDNKEWETAKLINVADYRRGSFPQPYGLAKWYDEFNGMPFIQVFDVDDNMRLKATTKNKISKLASKQSVFIGKGTLIVTLQGSIGRVAITQYDAYIDRTLLLFEKFYMDIDKVFFAYIIQRLFEIKKQSAPGGIIKTITKQALSEFTVKLPERPEQEKIAKFLSGIHDLISIQTERIEALKRHKKALIQGLFPVSEEVL